MGGAWEKDDGASLDTERRRDYGDTTIWMRSAEKGGKVGLLAPTCREECDQGGDTPGGFVGEHMGGGRARYFSGKKAFHLRSAPQGEGKKV